MKEFVGTYYVWQSYDNEDAEGEDWRFGSSEVGGQEQWWVWEEGRHGEGFWAGTGYWWWRCPCGVWWQAIRETAPSEAFMVGQVTPAQGATAARGW